MRAPCPALRSPTGYAVDSAYQESAAPERLVCRWPKGRRADMTVYHAYLEESPDGACLAHVPDLAGCTARGLDRAAALAALPAAIRSYLDWCAAHGDPLPQNGPIEVLVAEIVRGTAPWRRGGVNALFSADRAPLGDAELRTYLRRMTYAHADLLNLVRNLPAGACDATPSDADGARSIGEILVHLVETEAWYLSRLGQRIAVDPGGQDILSCLVDGRARAVEAILRLSPRQRDLVYVPTEQPSEDPEEGWTLRKVLRRVLEHELEHLDDLRRLYPSVSDSG
jgi:predicted RNase H-like HicB family nuclease